MTLGPNTGLKWLWLKERAGGPRLTVQGLVKRFRGVCTYGLGFRV